MVAPFIGRIWTFVTRRRKLAESWLARCLASHRVEKLVIKHGLETATEITRLGLAMCADPPSAEKLLPAPRRPLDDDIRRVIVVGDMTVGAVENADTVEHSAVEG